MNYWRDCSYWADQSQWDEMGAERTMDEKVERKQRGVDKRKEDIVD